MGAMSLLLTAALAVAGAEDAAVGPVPAAAQPAAPTAPAAEAPSPAPAATIEKLSVTVEKLASDLADVKARLPPDHRPAEVQVIQLRDPSGQLVGIVLDRAAAGAPQQPPPVATEAEPVIPGASGVVPRAVPDTAGLVPQEQPGATSPGR